MSDFKSKDTGASSEIPEKARRLFYQLDADNRGWLDQEQLREAYLRFSRQQRKYTKKKPRNLLFDATEVTLTEFICIYQGWHDALHNAPSTLVLITCCLQNDFFYDGYPQVKDGKMNPFWVGQRNSAKLLRTQVQNFIQWVRDPLKQIEQEMDHMDDIEVGLEEGTALTLARDNDVKTDNVSNSPQKIEKKLAINQSMAGAQLETHLIHSRLCNVSDRSQNDYDSDTEKGAYCLANTDGAALLHKLDEDSHLFPNEHIFDQESQMDRACTDQILSLVKKLSTDEKKLKVAVIGGWTDEAVYHMCYELSMRVPEAEIATCVELTASRSDANHWMALERLDSLMKVKVTKTLRELYEWMTDNRVYRLPGQQTRSEVSWPTFEWVGERPRAFNFDVDGELLALLYQHSHRLKISIIQGGMSGATVLSMQSWDKMNIREAPTVVKIGPRRIITQEYLSFQRVAEVLGNNAPAVRAFIELGDKAAIKFRYTRMAEGNVNNFHDIIKEQVEGRRDTVLALEIIDDVFGEIFERWYSSSKLDYVHTFGFYFDGFDNGTNKPVSVVHSSPDEYEKVLAYLLSADGIDPAPRYRNTPAYYSSGSLTDRKIIFPGLSFPVTALSWIFNKDNPSGTGFLRSLPPVQLYTSFQHGDANLGNFIVDKRQNVWVIDFLFTQPRNHILRDISKMWASLMFIGTRIESDAEFKYAMEVPLALARIKDLRTPLPEALDFGPCLHLSLMYRLFRRLYSHVTRIVRNNSDSSQLLIALASDSLRFLTYKARNVYSKRWAYCTASILLSACISYCEEVVAISPMPLMLNHKLLKGSIFLARVPGDQKFLSYYKFISEQNAVPSANPEQSKSQSQQSMAAFALSEMLSFEAAKLRNAGITDVLCLVAESEFAALGHTSRAFKRQMRLNDLNLIQVDYSLEIDSRLLGSVEKVIRLLCSKFSQLAIVSRLRRRKASFFVSCLLCALGYSPEEAASIVADKIPIPLNTSISSLVKRFRQSWGNKLLDSMLQAPPSESKEAKALAKSMLFGMASRDTAKEMKSSKEFAAATIKPTDAAIGEIQLDSSLPSEIKLPMTVSVSPPPSAVKFTDNSNTLTQQDNNGSTELKTQVTRSDRHEQRRKAEEALENVTSEVTTEDMSYSVPISVPSLPAETFAMPNWMEPHSAVHGVDGKESGHQGKMLQKLAMRKLTVEEKSMPLHSFLDQSLEFFKDFASMPPLDLSDPTASQGILMSFVSRALDKPANILSIEQIVGAHKGGSEDAVSLILAHSSDPGTHTVGKQLVAVVKVFNNIATFEFELAALGRCKIWLEESQVVDVPEVIDAAFANIPHGRVGGVLILSAAAGTPLDDLMIHLGSQPMDSVSRAIQFDQLYEAVARTAEAFAELHTVDTNSQLAADTVNSGYLEKFADHLRDIYNKLFNKLNIPKFREPLLEHTGGVMPEFLRKENKTALLTRIERFIEAVLTAPGLPSLAHGDAHMGNVFFDPTSSMCTFIDLASMNLSVGTRGEAIGCPDRDTAHFVVKMTTYGRTVGMSEDEIKRLCDLFLRKYESSGGRTTALSFAFFYFRSASGELHLAIKNGICTNNEYELCANILSAFEKTIELADEDNDDDTDKVDDRQSQSNDESEDDNRDDEIDINHSQDLYTKEQGLVEDDDGEAGSLVPLQEEEDDEAGVLGIEQKATAIDAHSIIQLVYDNQATSKVQTAPNEKKLPNTNPLSRSTLLSHFTTPLTTGLRESQSQSMGSDVLVVMGLGKFNISGQGPTRLLQSVLTNTVALVYSGKFSSLLLVGGRKPGWPTSEASAMQSWLRPFGISKNLLPVALERLSISWHEQVAFTHSLLKRRRFHQGTLHVVVLDFMLDHWAYVFRKQFASNSGRYKLVFLTVSATGGIIVRPSLLAQAQLTNSEMDQIMEQKKFVKGFPYSNAQRSLLVGAERGHVGYMRNYLASICKSNDDISVDAERNENGMTALHMACAGGYVDCVAFLLKLGANPNILTPTNIAPMHIAAVYGHFDIAKTLLDRGALTSLSIQATSPQDLWRGNLRPLDIVARRSFRPGMVTKQSNIVKWTLLMYLLSSPPLGSDSYLEDRPHGLGPFDHVFEVKVPQLAETNASYPNTNATKIDEKTAIPVSPHSPQQTLRTKTLFLMRHSESIWNANPVSGLQGMLDTRLTQRGHEQARQLGIHLRQSNMLRPLGIDLIVVSPLTRALQTYSHTLSWYAQEQMEKGIAVRVVVLPHVREHLLSTGTIGRPVDQLQEEFGDDPTLDFSHFERPKKWWYSPKEVASVKNLGYSDNRIQKVNTAIRLRKEPVEVFKARVEYTKRWLASQPENNIIVVGHGHFFSEFVGDETRRIFSKNLSVHRTTLSI